MQKPDLDFSSIRDSFRQHIQLRKNAELSEFVLIEEELTQNIVELKQKSFELLCQFRNVNQSTKDTNIQTFSSFEQFFIFVINQEEILNWELWKLEKIHNYLKQFSISNL